MEPAKALPLDLVSDAENMQISSFSANVLRGHLRLAVIAQDTPLSMSAVACFPV
jgi:hypothetical protein